MLVRGRSSASGLPPSRGPWRVPCRLGPLLATQWTAMLRYVGSPKPGRQPSQAGYSFVELVITVGMILVITTWVMPSFLNYLRGARCEAGASTVSAYLNELRQLALKSNR